MEKLDEGHSIAEYLVIPKYRRNKIGKKVAVVGGGNVAMDAARTALRLGAETHIVYRRSESELPARLEEVHHAKEEGVIFDILTNPTEILTDENGWVKGMKCVKMELGEQADILYHLLTEQMTKAEIKAESESQERSDKEWKR